MRTRYIQDRTTGRLVPAHEFYSGLPRPSKLLIGVKGITDAYVSPVDGSVISTLEQQRRHNERNDVVHIEEFGSDLPAYYARKAKEREELITGPKAKEERRQQIAAAVEKHKDNEFNSYHDFIQSLPEKGEADATR